MRIYCTKVSIDTLVLIAAGPIPKYDRHQSLIGAFSVTAIRWIGKVCESQLMATRPIITVVDDDESVRESLPDLLKEFGFEAQTFSSAEDFLASESIAETRCLVLDVAMPGMTGPDLQRERTRRDHSTRIDFRTAQRDNAFGPHLIAEGAADYLFKPLEATDLLQALNTALGAS